MARGTYLPGVVHLIFHEEGQHQIWPSLLQLRIGHLPISESSGYDKLKWG
jgi:hypothetical protein